MVDARPAFRSLALLLLVLGATHAGAEQAPAIEPGDRIRVTTTEAGAAPLDGHFLRTEADGTISLFVSGEGAVGVPDDRIAALEVSAGSRGRSGTGALVGLVIGTVGGAALGVALENDFGGDDDPVGAAVQGGIMLGSVTAIAGALIGSLVRTEDWTAVPRPWQPMARRRTTDAPCSGLAWSVRF